LSRFGAGPADPNALQSIRTYRGWQVGFLWSWVPLLLSVGVAVVCGLGLRGRSLPEAPLPWHQLTLLAAIVTGYLTGVRFVAAWAPSGIDLDAIGYTSERLVGLYVVVIAAALLLVGCGLRVREARALRDAEPD
jgi:hypothetical protein